MASLPDEIPTQPHTTSYLSRPLEGKSALTSAFRLVWHPSHERGRESYEKVKGPKMMQGFQRGKGVERLRGLRIQ